MNAEAFLAATHEAWAQPSPQAKCRQVFALARYDAAVLADAVAWIPPGLYAGHPAKPEMVPPQALPKRGLGKEAGRVALIHAIAHIEFNAINLALDALYRFAGLPGSYYRDWLSVAADEAHHFQMLNQRLADYGAAYGDLPAHNGLWEMAVKTAHDPMVRMALVPRVLEARGLDVTPGMIDRLQAVGDTQTVAILKVILEEEVPHVAVGSRWFRYCCEQRGLPPAQTFQQLFAEHMQGRMKGPFNEAARLAAGFEAAELAYLNGLQ